MRRALLFLCSLLTIHTLAASNESCNSNGYFHSTSELVIDGSCQKSFKGAVFVQRNTGRGIGMIEAEDFAFEAPSRTNSPSFGLLLLQAVLLLALLGVVMLVSNLIRERQYDAGKDQAYAQTYGGIGGMPRANDEFKIPSRATNVSAPLSPQPKIICSPPSPKEFSFQRDPALEESVHVPVNNPMHRSASLPAQGHYPSYGSPNLAVQIPALNLPVNRNTQSMPLGLNMDAAWANLGTHSSMTSEDGGSWTNSHPGTLPQMSPRPVSTGPPGFATSPSSSPPQILQAGSPGGSPIRSFPTNSPPPIAHSSPFGSLPWEHTPPVALSPPIAPNSQTSFHEVEEQPVLLQWFPQETPATASMSGGMPARTRSLSPLPSSHHSMNALDAGVETPTTPHFASRPLAPKTPSFTPAPNPDPTLSTWLSGSQSRPTRGQATLRPAADFSPRTASEANLRGVDGIVQWFNLATPRAGFVPSDLAPLGSASAPLPRRPTPKKPPKPSNVAKIC